MITNKEEILVSFLQDGETSNTLESFSYSAIAVEDNKDDKIIFDELKELIFRGDWETLLMKLMDYHGAFPVDFQDGNGNALVHHAASQMQGDCLRILIMEFSANPNIKADNGYAPIHLLVSSDCSCNSCTRKMLPCLQILMDGGANVDEEDDLGETALYGAAKNRLAEPASFLLANGANINHWVNGISVATLLAQYVPDVLKTQFDKRILINSKKGIHRSLRLDFRLLLQEVAVAEGLAVNCPVPSVSSSHFLRKGAKYFSAKRDKVRENGTKLNRLEEGRIQREAVSFLNKEGNGKPDSISASSLSSSLSTPTSEATIKGLPPRETELLNYLLKADFDAAEAVVNHPLVQSFVHLKWLTVRKLFFLLKSFYFFLISLYTFYVFDTFVNATCYFGVESSEPTITSNGLSSPTIPISGEEEAQMNSVVTLRNVSFFHNDNVNGSSLITEKATHETEVFLPFSSATPTPTTRSAKLLDDSSGIREHSYYNWHSFSEYFKAREMTCEPIFRSKLMAYVLSAYVVILILYELYKIFESWYDYLKSPVNLAWWIVAINFGITVTPGLGIYAHSWHYPYAAFSLVFGWIFLLAQVEKLPYLGTLVGVFVKVLKDFIVLLFTFSPVLLAFALGFSVLLPQHEFFRFLPTAFFKVFLMMTGDVDFWGVFRGTWTTVQHKADVYFPLFIIYSVYVLTVTMVLMSLLLGLAVENIQEVRREAALYRTVRLINEIGIFESLSNKPALNWCGIGKCIRSLFSIMSLNCMSGPELIIYPEDPQDQTLPTEIKKKLIPYLTSSCCSAKLLNLHRERECSDEESRNKMNRSHIKLARIKDPRKGLKLEKCKNEQNERRIGKGEIVTNQNESREGFSNNRIERKVDGRKAAAGRRTNDALRREFFGNQIPANANASAAGTPSTVEPNENQYQYQMQRNQQFKGKLLASRDFILFQDLRLLLEDNERLRDRLEALKYKLIHATD